MTAAREQNIFDEAFAGAPLTAPTRAPSVAWGMLTTFWVVIPKVSPAKAPDTQLLIRAVRHWTGWSTRTTAEALETTHTTVQAMELGRPLTERSGDLRRRLYDLHALVERVHALADQNTQRTGEVLRAEDATGLSPLAHIRAGDPSRAYLAALDALTPRRRDSRLLIGHRPARPGTASVSLTD